jgi:hypothetical protein
VCKISEKIVILETIKMFDQNTIAHLKPIYIPPSTCLLFVLLLLFVISCSKQEEQPRSKPQPQPTVIKIPENALAKVNETYITQTELEQMVRQTFGISVSKIKPAEKQKILESLIQRRLFASIQEKKLDKSEQEDLASNVKIYRAKLLVQQYLTQHQSTDKISPEKLRKYYDDHPLLFGTGYVYHYEHISSIQRLEPEDAQGLFSELSKAEKHNDWKAWAEKIKERGYPIKYYKKSFTNASMMKYDDFQLKVKGLPVGSCSKVIANYGYLHVLKLTQKEVSPPKRYFDVKAQVRNAYNRTRMSEEIQKAYAEVKAQADIEIF